MALFAAFLEHNLPTGYKRVEYLESDGNQYIDTGLKGGLDTFGVETKVYVNNSAYYYVLGNFNQTGQCGLMRRSSDTTKVIFIYYVSSNSTVVSLGTVNSEIVFSNKNNQIISNGVVKGTMPNNTSKLQNSNLCLFGTSIGTKFDASGKVYYLKIYSDLTQTNLIMDLIPCLDNNNVPCMYDKISGNTFYNAGTGTFSYGTVVNNLLRTKAAFVKDLLPEGYIRLDYIENPDQNAYINTGITPDDTTGFKARMSVRDITTDLYYLGCRESNQTDSRFGLGVYQGHTYMALGIYYSDVNGWTITRDTPFVAENNYKNSRVATMNGLYPVSVGSLSGITFTRNIYLFKANQQTSQTTESCRIYECEITQGTSVVAHFIPCFDDNGVACMYDTVRHQTFYSAGSSDFTANYIPPVVIPSGYTQLKYIYSDGSGQYVDTGYIATQTTNIECDFMVTQHNSNLLNYVYGEYTSGKACAIYISSSTNVYGLLYGNADRNTNIPRVFNEKVHSILNSAEFSINGTTESVGGGTFTATNTLYLFKGNGSSRPGMIGRIYYMLIREARGVVSRYLIPCLNSQNQVGFYDIITEQFYTNGGTGTFTYETGVYEDLPKYNSPVEIQLFNFN